MVMKMAHTCLFAEYYIFGYKNSVFLKNFRLAGLRIYAGIPIFNVYLEKFRSFIFTLILDLVTN